MSLAQEQITHANPAASLDESTPPVDDVALIDEPAAPVRDAAKEVFAIPELAEHILSYLPHKEIARARRIDVFTNTLIVNSPKLMADIRNPPTEDQSLRVRLHPILKLRREGSKDKYGFIRKDTSNGEITFRDHKGLLLNLSVRHVRDWDYLGPYEKLSLMLPPVKKLNFVFEFRDRKKIETSIESESGITIGMFMDHVEVCHMREKKKSWQRVGGWKYGNIVVNL